MRDQTKRRIAWVLALDTHEANEAAKALPLLAENSRDCRVANAAAAKDAGVLDAYNAAISIIAG